MLCKTAVIILTTGMKINPLIIVSTIIGLTLVGSSFLMTHLKPEAKGVPQNVLEQPTRSFITVDDKDGDGLPDWQNTLNISAIYLDEETSATTTLTKTASLAAELAALSLPGSNLDNASTLENLSARLAAESTDYQYTRTDIRVTNNNDTESLRRYGNRVAEITFEYAPPKGTENEMMILNRAMSMNDTNIIEKLKPITASYEGMLSAMLVADVPSTLVKEHLSLINVYNAILNDIRAFENVFDDALPAMTRLRRYQADTEALYLAVSNLYLKLDKAGIKWTDADIASRFIKIE